MLKTQRKMMIKKINRIFFMTRIFKNQFSENAIR